MLQWIKLFIDDLFSGVAMRLASERGEASINDKGDPEEKETPEDEFEKEFEKVVETPKDEDEPKEPSEEDIPPEDKPSLLEEAQVLEYLKSKGIDAASLNDVSTRYKGFDTLQQKHDSKAQILKLLRTARPEEFDKLLADAASAYDGEVPKVPNSLSKMDSAQINTAQEQIAHLAQPAMNKLKDDIKTELLFEKFAEDNPDYSQYKQTMGEIAIELGITKPTKKNLTTLMKMAKDQEAELAKSLLDKNKNNQPGKTKTIGIPPAGNPRVGTQDTKTPKTEAEWEERYNVVHKKAYG